MRNITALLQEALLKFHFKSQIYQHMCHTTFIWLPLFTELQEKLCIQQMQEWATDTVALNHIDK